MINESRPVLVGALTELPGLVAVPAGASGFAQSANQAERRGASRAPAPAEQELLLGEEGDRDVRVARVSGLRQQGNRTFYRRTVGWVDANLADLDNVEETVKRWSQRFYELLRNTTQEENARLAQAGTLVLEIQGRVLRITD